MHLILKLGPGGSIFQQSLISGFSPHLAGLAFWPQVTALPFQHCDSSRLWLWRCAHCISKCSSPEECSTSVHLELSYTVEPPGSFQEFLCADRAISHIRIASLGPGSSVSTGPWWRQCVVRVEPKFSVDSGGCDPKLPSTHGANTVGAPFTHTFLPQASPVRSIHSRLLSGHCLRFFYFCCDKISWHKRPKREKMYLGHNSRL